MLRHAERGRNGRKLNTNLRQMVFAVSFDSVTVLLIHARVCQWAHVLYCVLYAVAWYGIYWFAAVVRDGPPLPDGQPPAPRPSPSPPLPRSRQACWPTPTAVLDRSLRWASERQRRINISCVKQLVAKGCICFDVLTPSHLVFITQNWSGLFSERGR